MLKAIEKETGCFVVPALLAEREREIWKKEKAFLCPDCKQPVILKNGTKVTPHFAHRSVGLCLAEEGGEGEYHAKGKIHLYQWLVDQGITVKLEPYLPDIQQRPDLLIEINDKKIALEFQCAAISPDIFQKRTSGYLNAGMTPIWVLGGNRQKRVGTNALSLTAGDKLFLHHYRSDYTPLLYFYCSTTKQFCFFHHIYFTGSRKNYGILHYADLKSLSFLSLFQWRQRENRLITKDWLKEKKRIRLLTPSVYHPEMQQWFARLYKQDCHPGTLPNFIGLPVASQYKLNKSPSIWQSELLFHFLLPLPVNQALHLDRCRKFLSSYFTSPGYFSLSSVSSCPIEEFFYWLTELGLFIKKEDSVYLKRKEILFPGDIEAAWKSDQELYKKMTGKKALSF